MVRLLEAPVFTFLRLHLLQPATYPSLMKALYGLLMVLPQVLTWDGYQLPARHPQATVAVQVHPQDQNQSGPCLVVGLTGFGAKSDALARSQR